MATAALRGWFPVRRVRPWIGLVKRLLHEAKKIHDGRMLGIPGKELG